MLRCPSCNATIASRDVNVGALVAKCDACDHVFRFDPGALSGAAPSAARPPERPAPGRPESIRDVSPAEARVAASGYREATEPPVDPVVLVRRWFRPLHVFLFFFCVVWDGFLVNWYVASFTSDAGSMVWIMRLFPILHVAVGVGLTYTVLTGFLNRTTVTLDDAGLRVRHHPLPWRTPPALSARDIASFEVGSQARSSTNSVSTGNHEVRAVTRTGEARRLMGGLDENEARYVAWRLATALDVPVA